MPTLDYSKWDKLSADESDDEACSRNIVVTKTAAAEEPLPAKAAEPIRRLRKQRCAHDWPKALDQLASVQEAGDATKYLQSGDPVVLRGACVCWKASEQWTWAQVVERFGTRKLRLRHRGGSSPMTRRLTTSVRKLVSNWWPEEVLSEIPLGCKSWRLFDEHPEALQEVHNMRVRGVPRPKLPVGKAAKSKAIPSKLAPTRTAVTIGEAGFVTSPLRTSALGRHSWFACVRGAQRYVIVPRSQSFVKHLNVRDTSKGRRVSRLDPARLREEQQSLFGDALITCTLLEGDVLVVPAGCLVWGKNIWSSLVVRHCFVMMDNLIEFQHLVLRERMAPSTDHVSEESEQTNSDEEREEAVALEPKENMLGEATALNKETESTDESDKDGGGGVRAPVQTNAGFASSSTAIVNFDSLD